MLPSFGQVSKRQYLGGFEYYKYCFTGIQYFTQILCKALSTALDVALYKINIIIILNITFRKNFQPLMWAPGLTQFVWMMGVVAKVTVQMMSAPRTASSAVLHAFAPISVANFCAFARVRLQMRTWGQIITIFCVQIKIFSCWLAAYGQVNNGRIPGE